VTRHVRAVGGARIATPFAVVVVRDITKPVRMAEIEREIAGAQRDDDALVPQLSQPEARAATVQSEALVEFHVRAEHAFRMLRDTHTLDDNMLRLATKLQSAMSRSPVEESVSPSEASMEPPTSGEPERARADARVLDEMNREARRTVRQLCAQVAAHGTLRWAETQRALSTIKAELLSAAAMHGTDEESVAGAVSQIDELLALVEPPPSFHGTRWAELRSAIDAALSAAIPSACE